MTEKQWIDTISKQLIGRTIKKVRYMSEKEATEMGWSGRAIIIELNDGTELMASQDDEGNGPGAIFTNIDNLPIIPVYY